MKWLILRLVVSVGLLGLLAWQFDWGEIDTIRDKANPVWMLGAATFFMLSQILGALRWQAIANSLQIVPDKIPPKFAMKLTLMGLWYSNFLPSAVGGDLVRITYTWRRGGSLFRAVMASMLDRGWSAVGQLAALALCLLFADIPIHWIHEFNFMVGLPFVGMALIVLILTIRELIHWRKLRRIFRRALAALTCVMHDRVSLCRQVMLTVLSVACGFVAYWCSVRAVDGTPLFSNLTLAASFAVLASMLPISIAGWGVREGVLIVLLEQVAGLDPMRATFAAAVNAFVILVVSLIGLIVGQNLNMKKQ